MYTTVSFKGTEVLTFVSLSGSFSSKNLSFHPPNRRLEKVGERSERVANKKP